MEKRRPDTQLVTTSIALFFITLSICFINNQQPGYSQYLHHVDWYSEFNETSRIEDRREDDNHDLLALNPVSFHPLLYTERFYTSLRATFGLVKKNQWQEPPRKKLTQQLAQSYRAPLVSGST